MEYIGIKIITTENLMDWKSQPELINQVFDTVTQKSLECDERSSNFSNFLDTFIGMLGSNNLKESYVERMFDVIRASHERIDKPDATIHYTSRVCCAKYPWVEQPKNIPEHVKLLVRTVKKNATLHEGHALCYNCVLAVQHMFSEQRGLETMSGTSQNSLSSEEVIQAEAVTALYAAHTKVLDDVTEMFKFCADQESTSSDDPNKKSFAFVMLKTVMENYLGLGRAKVELCRPMMGTIIELWNCRERELQRFANYIIMSMVEKGEVLSDEVVSALIEKFLITQDLPIASKLRNIHESTPHLIYSYLPEISKFLINGDNSTTAHLINLMVEVVKLNPEKLPAGTTDAIASYLSDSILWVSALCYFEAAAPVLPEEVLVHEEKLIQRYQRAPESGNGIGNILAQLANTKDRQKRYLALFAEKLARMPRSVHQRLVIINIHQVGLMNVEALREHKTIIEKIHSYPEHTQMCQPIVDLIYGRSLEGVSSDVTAQRQDINQLDTRVTHNEVEVMDIRTDVNTNKINIIKVTEEVQGQGQKLNDLKQVVDETIERVDELDRKTLNHAPAWSRDVARLLNIQSDRDWRLLASRLGYRGGDIQGWATQPDPCLSMLDEWFATQNTREATNAVRKNLIEINRTDASNIIDTALKSVENVINDTPGEPTSPLPIFISYQWAQQREAKLLRKHLALAGYPAYMDVGQILGGGGGLFSQIDSGIRAARVVICCVTKKYAESENCTKEVNLSTALGKPMIPLLMEKMVWPPAGSMGPIFGEYLFIRFFQKEGSEQTRDERFWPHNKFQELLTQLRYHVAPEMDALLQDSPYNNWCLPSQIPAISKVSHNKGMTPVEVPETFYKQWDSQVEMKSLYRRLESLGYSCWLDTEQMGGGDSLYDKIDKGLRACHVMISCVTAKYAKSANCRREVSLADALKKPIIPLKLERGLAWPPEGPMSMVLTSLTPIDFSQYDPQTLQHWNCAEFEVLHKALSHKLGRQPFQV